MKRLFAALAIVSGLLGTCSVSARDYGRNTLICLTEAANGDRNYQRSTGRG